MASIEEEMRQSRQAAEELATPVSSVNSPASKTVGAKAVLPPSFESSMEGPHQYPGMQSSTEEFEREKQRKIKEAEFIGPPIPESIKRKREAVEDAYSRILREENNKNYPKGGWNEQEQRWYPHDSVEGGAQTIAYGIKLSNGSKWAKIAKEQGYLTDEQALQAAKEMSNDYYESAKKTYNKRYPKEENAWDKLTPKQQSILTDYEYTGTLSSFKDFMDAMHDFDVEKMKREYKRYSNGKEIGRNERMLEEIEALIRSK